MLIAHSALYMLGRGLPGVINLLAIVTFTRLLTPTDYGQVALVVAAVALLNVVLFQWLRLSLVRFYPAEVAEPGRLLGAILGLFAAVALAIGIAGTIVLASTGDAAWRKLIAIVVPLLWAQAWFELNLALSVTRLDPVRFGWMSGAKAMLALLLGVMFVAWDYGATGPLFGLLIALAVVGAVSSRTSWTGAIWHWDRARVARIARYGLPLSMTLALGYVISASDRFLLAGFLDADTAGLYAAAYDLGSQAITALLMVVNLAGNPLLVRALEFHGEEAAKQQARQNAALLLIVALPAASGIALLAPDMAMALVGPDFREAAELILPIVALASLLAGLRAYYFDLAFQLGHWTVGQAWIVGAAAILNLALNLWWIPAMGMPGAAWATVVAYAFALALSILLGRRSFALPFPWSAAGRVAIATAAMLAAMWLVPGEAGAARLVLRALFGATAFVVTAWSLGLVAMLRSPELALRDAGR